MMNVNPIIIQSDLGDNGSSSLRRRMELSSHSLPYACTNLELKIAPLIGDFETEGVSEDAFLRKKLSNGPSGALLLGKTGEGEDPFEKPMPHLVLIEVYEEVAQQRREHACSFFQLYRRTSCCELNNIEIVPYLEC